MEDYLLTRDILYRIGKVYVANLSEETSSEAGHLIIAIQDMEMLSRKHPLAAADYTELLNICKQRVRYIMK